MHASRLPGEQDKENNLKPGGALKQWMEQQRAYSTEMTTARGSQLEASAAAAAAAPAEPRAQQQRAPDFRELYADLPLLNDAAATIQRHVRGLRDRRRTREYCRAILDDADAADALYMERGALPEPDRTPKDGTDRMAVARRREERIRARAVARGEAADAAGGGGDAPSVVLLRRRCRELEAKCASVSLSTPHLLFVCLPTCTYLGGGEYLAVVAVVAATDAWGLGVAPAAGGPAVREQAARDGRGDAAPAGGKRRLGDGEPRARHARGAAQRTGEGARGKARVAPGRGRCCGLVRTSTR